MRTIYVSLALLFAFVGSIMAQNDTLMISNAKTMLGNDYVAGTLEVNGADEQLVINCDEVDCTTFVEYALAMSLCPTQGRDMSENDFAKNLLKIRYRDGKVNGYASRLHYISEWIDNGVNAGLIEDITAQNAQATAKLSLSYMSKNTSKYEQLAASAKNVAEIKKVEKAYTGKTVKWVPAASLTEEGPDYVKDGDIIVIMTNIAGLDVAHMGIAIHVDGKLTLMHASSTQGKVVVDDNSLKSLTANHANWTGIRVLRMKK
jgi:hypothetical protein